MAAMGVMDMLLWLTNLGLVVCIIVLGSKGDSMDVYLASIAVLCQCLVAFPVFSVMTIRASQATPFRPTGATTLEQEFQAYGFPTWFYWLVRIVKPSCAVLLIVGLVLPWFSIVGAGGILVFMIGALGSHIKVKDPLQRSIPSFTLGCMCACLVWFQRSKMGLDYVFKTSYSEPLKHFPGLDFFNYWPVRLWLCSFFLLAFFSMLATTLCPTKVDLVFWLGNAAIACATLAVEFTGYESLAAGLMVVCQCLVAFAAFSVMTVRASQETPFRPGNAKTLEEEFAYYGYPSCFYKLIRVVKPLFAVFLVVGILPFCKKAALAGAGGMLILMIGAVGSHIKVGDPILKSVPSFTLGSLSACILVVALRGSTWKSTCSAPGLCLPVDLPPAVYASELGRYAGFITMTTVFSVLLLQMLTAPALTSAREPLLSS